MSTKAPEPTDEEIAMLVQHGETEQFGILVQRYEQKLLRYGRKFLSAKEDISDIVQDVFLKAYQNIQGFNASLRFSPWIYRIAHNAFVNELRRRTSHPIISLDLDTLISHPVYEDPTARERELQEMKDMSEAGLERLQPKYREVLILYYHEEMSYKEIADILQVPVGTVGIRLKRAKDALRKVFKELNLSYGD